MCKGNFGSELSRGREDGEEERVRAKMHRMSAKFWGFFAHSTTLAINFSKVIMQPPSIIVGKYLA